MHHHDALFRTASAALTAGSAELLAKSSLCAAARCVSSRPCVSRAEASKKASVSGASRAAPASWPLWRAFSRECVCKPPGTVLTRNCPPLNWPNSGAPSTVPASGRQWSSTTSAEDRTAATDRHAEPPAATTSATKAQSASLGSQMAPEPSRADGSGWQNMTCMPKAAARLVSNSAHASRPRKPSFRALHRLEPMYAPCGGSHWPRWSSRARVCVLLTSDRRSPNSVSARSSTIASSGNARTSRCTRSSAASSSSAEPGHGAVRTTHCADARRHASAPLSSCSERVITTCARSSSAKFPAGQP